MFQSSQNRVLPLYLFHSLNRVPTVEVKFRYHIGIHLGVPSESFSSHKISVSAASTICWPHSHIKVAGRLGSSLGFCPTAPKHPNINLITSCAYYESLLIQQDGVFL